MPRPPIDVLATAVDFVTGSEPEVQFCSLGSGSAGNALLAQADGSRRGGNLNGAIASAERALRIAPADPVAYYELALLRLAHGERAVAEQLARKGLSCQPDAELRQRLQDLITRAYSG